MDRLRISRLLLAICILAILVVLILPRGAIAARLPVPQASLRLASQGIAHAADWTPVIHLSSGMDWALVPAGCFTMGSTDAQLEQARGSCNQYSGGDCNYDFALNEQPAHQVCFDKPYWIGATEVTNARYGSGSSTGLYRMLSRRSWPRESVTW